MTHNVTGTDHQYMARALQLAAQGLYTTHPNPRVGCVIVRDGENPRRELAACWSVEVMNGARGDLFCSDSSMSTICQDSFFAVVRIVSTCRWSRGSFEQVRVRDWLLGVLNTPEMTQ